MFFSRGGAQWQIYRDALNLPMYILLLSLHETQHDFECLANYLCVTFNLRIICNKHDNDNIIII